MKKTLTVRFVLSRIVSKRKYQRLNNRTPLSIMIFALSSLKQLLTPRTTPKRKASPLRG